MVSALWASAIRERDVERSQASYITSCALAIASSRLRAPIAARKLSIARRSGNALPATAVFVFGCGSVDAVFRRGFLETGITFPLVRSCATIAEPSSGVRGWLKAQYRVGF